MDGSGSDYSDYEYQQFDFTHRDSNPVNNGVSNPNSRTRASFEPLSEVGGLDTNEVAELVYLELYAEVEFEDDLADQDVATSTEMRGSFGVDLDEDDEIGNLSGKNGEVTSLNNAASTEDQIAVKVRSFDRDEVLQTYRLTATPPFDDQTNGPGGAAGSTHFYAEKKYRNLTGRGPVLDSADNLTIVNNLITSDTVIACEGAVRGHMVWDVSSVDDAGRRFSVPQ